MPMKFLPKKWNIMTVLWCSEKTRLFYFSGKYFFITFAVRKKDHYGQSMSGYRKKTHHGKYGFAFKYKNPQKIFT